MVLFQKTYSIHGSFSKNLFDSWYFFKKPIRFVVLFQKSIHTIIDSWYFFKKPIRFVVLFQKFIYILLNYQYFFKNLYTSSSIRGTFSKINIHPRTTQRDSQSTRSITIRIPPSSIPVPTIIVRPREIASPCFLSRYGFPPRPSPYARSYLPPDLHKKYTSQRDGRSAPPIPGRIPP